MLPRMDRKFPRCASAFQAGSPVEDNGHRAREPVTRPGLRYHESLPRGGAVEVGQRVVDTGLEQFWRACRFSESRRSPRCKPAAICRSIELEAAPPYQRPFVGRTPRSCFFHSFKSASARSVPAYSRSHPGSRTDLYLSLRVRRPESLSWPRGIATLPS
jgi:hypothetical protein